MRVEIVPVLEDNFSYLVIDETTNEALSVDPGVASKVLEKAKDLGVKITQVLTTHHHWDHADGNPGMVEAIPDLVVVGGDDRIPKMTKKVGHSDEWKFGNLKIVSLFTPCHTSGHVLYYITEISSDYVRHPSSLSTGVGALFTGDTLFVAGCGRFFEGDGTQMDRALNNVISSLPHDTLVYVGHEYTVSNLKFAQHIEKENPHVADKLEWAKNQIEAGLHTVPSSIAQELTFNPFMRVNEPSVKKSLGLSGDASPSEVMTKLREAKNNFK